MESPITAIGFSEIDKKYTIEELVGEILEKPTKQQVSRNKNKAIIAEYIKEFGKDTYVMVRIVVRPEEGQKNAKEETSIEVEQCEPYLNTRYTLNVEELSVEEIDDEYNYYAICEEKETGIQFIFWLQNVIEYTEAAAHRQDFNQIKVAALAMEGTIVLPVEQDEEDLTAQKEEKEKIKVMLQKAREGDEEAKMQLEEEEKEMDDLLKARLYEEDFLTIMSGYFIPTTLVDATYAILGEITSIDTRRNSRTGEEMYLFTLDVNDMPLEVMINKKQLVGYPTIGMRFMGTCWLQGTIVID
ncbi:MAG: DUF3881 family protein [Candidatus Cellulosilyticum pullistercoris]|uniref:DUF3881 family protein n=1 Tax=Candidatus Cellulosilyticum pullistercoris TaxID=2838521 RepID=A0A9E2KD23_9FIRM|nr:DUF3881 family protein [Candidatus Cellulosilyticum pullistercoris]